MCGIVGFLDKRGERDPGRQPVGGIMLAMLQALACRGPDGAGIALLRESGSEPFSEWLIRIAPADPAPLARLQTLGGIGVVEPPEGETLAFRFFPNAGTTLDQVGTALGAARGGLEVLSLGESIDLVKQVGTPDDLEATFGISRWTGRLAIGHTRMSTESRIDLSHSQPFWAHGCADLATAHNGHVTNYHQLRRRYEQAGATFYTDNDSEVIGVYLRDRLDRGRSLPEALNDSIQALDGAFNYLVVSPEGLGVVRDRYGFKPLMLAETDDFVAVATEEIALRRALPADYKVTEPKPGRAAFYPNESLLLRP